MANPAPPDPLKEKLAELEARLLGVQERVEQAIQILVRTETRLCKLIVHLGAKDEVKIKE